MEELSPMDRKDLTFDEREAAVRVIWVLSTYLTANELKGQRRPDYLKAMADVKHALHGFQEKLEADREKAGTDRRRAARRGRVDDSGWTNDQIAHELAAMADMLKGLKSGEAQEP